MGNCERYNPNLASNDRQETVIRISVGVCVGIVAMSATHHFNWFDILINKLDRCTKLTIS